MFAGSLALMICRSSLHRRIKGLHIFHSERNKSLAVFQDLASIHAILPEIAVHVTTVSLTETLADRLTSSEI